MVSSVQATPSSVVQLASVNWVLDVDSVGLPGPSFMCGAGYDTTIRLGWMITDMDDCVKQDSSVESTYMILWM